MTGRTISHYRVLEKLGEGGMGVVYKAEDLKLRRNVALKFLPPHTVEHAEFRDRFVREAQAAATLHHANICTVFELDEEHGLLAMELVEGRSLREKIHDRPLKLEEALRIGCEIGEGLRVAHQRGVVHRDIKCGNILLTAEGQAKITDFGLAMLADRTRMTKTGMSLGTPGYMAPEQARGEKADRRVDIWALGVVLYEMIAGRLPFAGESEAAVVHSILHDNPEPLTAQRAGLPMELDRVVAKCLEKARAERYQHVEDLLVDLSRLKRESGAGHRVVKRGGARRGALWAAAAALVLAAGAAGTWLVKRLQPEAPVNVVPVTSYLGSEADAKLSPDGKHVVFSWNTEREDNFDIYVQLIGAGTPLRLTTEAADDFSPTWSPDGRAIAFLRDTRTGKFQILAVPAMGGVERTVGEVFAYPRGHGFDGPWLEWTPDGKSLVVVDRDAPAGPTALLLLSPGTGEKRRLTFPPAEALGDTGPAFSPDGRSLAFRRITAYHVSDIMVVRLKADYSADGEPKAVTHGAFAFTPAWTPDGDELVYSEGPYGNPSLWRVSASGRGTPRRIAAAGEGASAPSVFRGGPGMLPRLLYIRWLWDVNIWRVGVQGNASPVRVIASTRREFEPGWSPDGQRVCFVSDRAGRYDLWASRADGTQALQLTDMGSVQYPRWSPDGTSIVFSSGVGGQQEIYTISANGGAPKRLTNHPALDWTPFWSRDGQWIYFTSERSGRGEIWKVPPSGGDLVQVTREGGTTPQESPDGRYLYYAKANAGIWRQPSSGGEEQLVVEEFYQGGSAYAAGDGMLYYVGVRDAEGRMPLRAINLRTRATQTVASLEQKARPWGLSLSPDGFLLFAQHDQDSSDLMMLEGFR